MRVGPDRTPYLELRCVELVRHDVHELLEAHHTCSLGVHFPADLENRKGREIDIVIYARREVAHREIFSCQARSRARMQLAEVAPACRLREVRHLEANHRNN